MNTNGNGYIQDAGSLRLMLNFSKLKDIEGMNFAFNVLKQKKNHKSAYITEALHHYDQACNDNYFKRVNEFELVKLYFIKSYYSIETKEDLEKLLSCGKDSATFRNAEKWKLSTDDFGELREMLLGFSKTDPIQKKMHDRLFNMTVNDRMFLIVDVVKTYVEDNQDSETTTMIAFSLIHDLILEYESLNTPEEKEKMVDKYWRLLELSDQLEYKCNPNEISSEDAEDEAEESSETTN